MIQNSRFFFLQKYVRLYKMMPSTELRSAFFDSGRMGHEGVFEMKRIVDVLKKAIGIVFLIAIGAVFGIFLGKFVGNYADSPIYVFLWLALAIILYILQLIMHEAGHYLFGRLSGYTFVSFRIDNYTWIKENGKLVLKRFKIPGTGGQCLMMPPKEDINGDKYVLYHMGGVIVNSIFTVSGVLMYFLCGSINIKAVGAILAFVAGAAAITNGIPFKFAGIANDGYQVMLLKKDKIARRSTYIMLKVNGLLTQGVRMKEMPYEWFVLPEEADLSNPSNAAIRILEGNWFFDKLQFEEAKTCYETLLDDSIRLLDVHKMELQCEVLFFELMNMQRKDVIKDLYTRKMKSYIKTMSSVSINKKRLQYALCLYERKKGWEEELEKIYEEALKMRDTYPVKAEIEGEMEVFDFLRAPKQIFANWEENSF